MNDPSHPDPRPRRDAPGGEADTAMISARVPVHLADALARQSLRERVSMSVILRTALARFLHVSL